VSSTTKKIFTRISQKHDLEVNWLKAENFVPMQGELIVYDIEVDVDGNTLTDNNGLLMLPEGRAKPYTYERFKIGDGIKTVTDLPFIVDEAVGNIGTDNDIISDNSFASGANNIAGGKAFKIVAEPVDNLDGTGVYPLDSVEGIEVGMTYSAVTSTAVYHQGTIESISAEFKTVIVNNFKGYPLNKSKDDPTNYAFYNTFIIDGHPELGTIEIGYNAHVEGQNNIAHNVATHAEGKDTKALGKFSHAEGLDTIAGHSSHSEGAHTKALGAATHAEGDSTTSDGHYSHAEGYKTRSSGKASHAEGVSAEAIGDYSHSEGESTKAIEIDTHAEGFGTEASGKYSHAEGYQSKSSGFVSHAEGCRTESSGEYSHSQGNDTIAQGKKSHAEGQNTYAKGENAHAEGLGSNTRTGNKVTAGTTGALGKNSHSEGNTTTASGDDSHAEGRATTASGLASHAEGVNSLAQGAFSHAEGNATQAIAALSHTEGQNTITKDGANYAHAEGNGTVATAPAQHVQGRFNIEDINKQYAHIVGNGTSEANRQNAHTIDWNGNAWFTKDVYVGGTKQSEGKKLATEEFVNTKVSTEVASLVGAAPETLNTLNELATALGNNENFATTVTEELGKKANSSDVLAHTGNVNNPHSVTAAQVGAYTKEETNSAITQSTQNINTSITNLTNTTNTISEKVNALAGESDTSVTNDLENNTAIGEFSSASGTMTYAYGEASEASGIAVRVSKSKLIGDIEIGKVKLKISSIDVNNNLINVKSDPLAAGFKTLVDELNNTGNTGFIIEVANRLIPISNYSTVGGSFLAGYTCSLTPYIALTTEDTSLVNQSVAEVYVGMAYGDYSHTEGKNNTALGIASHAEGVTNTARSEGAHAEGYSTEANGLYSHSEGCNTTASGDYSHAEGNTTIAAGGNSHAEGNKTKANKAQTHAEGNYTIADSNVQHVEGSFNIVDSNDKYLHIIGNGTSEDSRSNAFTVDWSGNGEFAGTVKTKNIADVDSTLVDLSSKIKSFYGTGEKSHVEGDNPSSSASGKASHTEGYSTTATNIAAHAEGFLTNSRGEGSHAEGYQTNANFQGSHAEGTNSSASSVGAHAEGQSTTASNLASHAEGYNTTASGMYSHAEGNNTIAEGGNSHAEGYKTKASGAQSHAEGQGTIAYSVIQHVQGKYNKVDSGNHYAHIVGNGSSEEDRSDAHTLDWNGNAWFAGSVKVGTANKALATEEYVDDKIASMADFAPSQHTHDVATYSNEKAYWNYGDYYEIKQGDILIEENSSTSITLTSEGISEVAILNADKLANDFNSATIKISILSGTANIASDYLSDEKHFDCGGEISGSLFPEPDTEEVICNNGDIYTKKVFNVIPKDNHHNSDLYTGTFESSITGYYFAIRFTGTVKIEHLTIERCTDGYICGKDLNKLKGVEVGANKTIVDNELSSESTNPIANNIITEEFNQIRNEIDSISSSGANIPSDSKIVRSFTTSGSGSIYTATIDNYTAYTKGDVFIMIPHTTATTTSPRLNINNLGNKYIYRNTYSSGSTTSLRSTTELSASYPVMLVYNGNYFVMVDNKQPYGDTDFYNKISASKLGAGAMVFKGTVDSLSAIDIDYGLIQKGDTYKPTILRDERQLTLTISGVESIRPLESYEGYTGYGADNVIINCSSDSDIGRFLQAAYAAMCNNNNYNWNIQIGSQSYGGQWITTPYFDSDYYYSFWMSMSVSQATEMFANGNTAICKIEVTSALPSDLQSRLEGNLITNDDEKLFMYDGSKFIPYGAGSSVNEDEVLILDGGIGAEW
jgi:hypothetical protein